MSVCSRIADLSCPVDPCPGKDVASVCSHLNTLRLWRQIPIEDQVNRFANHRPVVNPVVRDAVNACRSRGPVLPISMQEDCGCRGKELSECRDSRGTLPGRVTLQDCLQCQGSRLLLAIHLEEVLHFVSDASHSASSSSTVFPVNSFQTV